MSSRYQTFINKLTNNYGRVRSLLGELDLDFDSFFQTFPSHTYDSLWIPCIQSQGFSCALPLIDSSIDTYLRINSQNRDSNYLKKQHSYISEVICPMILTFKTHNCSSQQIVNRTKQMKKSWKLNSNICSHLIPYLECNEQKENQPESKKQKIISDILLLFDTNQSKLDYKGYGLLLLNQSISEIVYDLNNVHLTYEEIYKKLCITNRQKIIYFLSKIKKKENVCASILSEIVDLENNLTTNQKIMNICKLFLFTEYWDRFKESDSKLKEGIVIEIFAQAFQRLLYLAYDNDEEVTLLFLQFLNSAKFSFYDQIKQAIAYHLLALYKLNRYAQKTVMAKLIEHIWTDKLKGVKINQVYSEYSPTFVTKSQKGDEKPLDQTETKSINSKSTISQIFTLRSNRTSKSKPNRSTRGNCFYKKVKQIEDELRKCNFERIYLLIESLKRNYLVQFEERRMDESSRNIMLGLVIQLIKKIEGKIMYRYSCNLLKKCIFLEIMELKERCFETYYQFNQKNESLGLFECCYIDKGEINFENLIKFHQRNCYEDTLQTLLSLKSLNDELNSNTVTSSKLQFYEEQLQSTNFQVKVYYLYKNEFNENKKIDIKRLVIICRLLLLNSCNITNNLLVNYVYSILKHEKNNDNGYKKKLESYSKLMNEEITQFDNEERVKILLKMGEIFQEFENKLNEQAFRLIDSAIGNKYFEFLRRKEHSAHYYMYSSIYLKMNYLKQSLYFLQLHNFTQKKQSLTIVKDAIKIYERLNNPFKTYMNSILMELKIDPQSLNFKQSLVKQNQKWNLEMILNSFMNRIDLQTNQARQYEQLYINDNPRIQLWLSFYYPYLKLFLHEIQSLKQSQEINESLRRYNILLKYINLKIDLIKEPLFIITYDRLSSVISQIQQLKNYAERNYYSKHFLKILRNSNVVEHLESIYLENILKCKNYEDMLTYLRQNLKQNQANAKMQSNYLIHLIKYHFQRSQFDKCLSMIKILQERKEKIGNLTEIYHMQLECRHKTMLNYTIEEYLSLINKCITSSSKNITTENKENHFKYYFKIFRMLFNRYTFANSTHNEIFLQTYFHFIDNNSILTDNLEFISETIFYLLRFVAQKFDYSNTSPQRPFQKVILQKFKGKLEHIVPFCNYLIKRISFNPHRNYVIKSILKAVLTQHSKECIWIISFLKNFSVRTPKNLRLSSEEANQLEKLAELYKEVYEVLQAKKILNVEHLNWIDNLVKLSLSQTQQKKQKALEFKQSSIPAELLFMFHKDFYINRIQDIKILSNGKSAPLQILFSLVHVREKNYQNVKVIIKGNIGNKKYRMESNTANFFEQIGLIDREITYKIIHLSKYLVSIEHRANCGTINSIIIEYLPEVKKMESKILVDLQKRRQGNPNNNNPQRRLLQIYDSNNRPQNQVKFSQIIFYKSRNIKDWWRRYNNFVRTHAQWSYLGYIVGLGDRHCDNILITQDAKLIHIDFQYALDTGLKLPCPEWVPFRLTSCFVQPLGALGVFGIYYAEMINTVKQFEEKQHNIWRALSNFIGSMDTNVCEQIIQRSKFLSLNVNSIEEGVAKLIHSAKDPQLLRLMFEGWRAYL